MNIDFIGLWHALEQLPLFIAITVFALVVLTVAALVVFPAFLALISEPFQIRKSLLCEFSQLSQHSGWRNGLPVVANCLTAVNTVIGRLTAWLVIYMTLMQFVVVIMRYVFSYGSIQMQESIWYLHGLLFMLGAGYTLAKEGHVRLDVFYRAATERTRAWINLIGAVVCLVPFCIVNFDLAWSFVLNSWAVREGSTEAAGLPYIYLFKTVILIFSVLVAMEGVALGARSLFVLTAERDSSNVTADKS